MIAIIQIGDNTNIDNITDGLTTSYFVNKRPITISEHDLLLTIDVLNNDKTVNGIIVTEPLPEHINKNTVNKVIQRKKYNISNEK